MSDMKCPVCGEKIEHIEDGWCNCKNRCLGSGSIDLWLNFIRTRKALDVAVDALKQIKDGKIPVSLGIYMDINDALEQITTEQKE